MNKSPQVTEQLEARGNRKWPSELRRLLICLSNDLPTKKGGRGLVPPGSWLESIPKFGFSILREHPLDVTQGAHVGPPKKLFRDDTGVSGRETDLRKSRET